MSDFLPISSKAVLRFQFFKKFDVGSFKIVLLHQQYEYSTKYLKSCQLAFKNLERSSVKYLYRLLPRLIFL